VWSNSLSNLAPKALRVLTVIAAVFLISVPLLSQTSQGTIQGAIFDQTGGAIPGATELGAPRRTGISTLH
jgi:hypothetical protein